MSQHRHRVALIGTGGTISSRGRHSLDLYEYGEHADILEAADLIAGVPELSTFADILPVRFRTLSSTAVRPHDWLELNRVIHELANSEALDGIVITHGTATLEETAFFLNLTVKSKFPVVLVGSQRPWNALSSDGPMNLLNAVRVACSPHSKGLGVLTLLNDEIQAARDVTKTSTYRLETFRSPDLGMLGYADADGEIVIYRRPSRRHSPDTEFDTRGIDELPRVDIAYSYAGADGTAIDAFVSAGARGVVVASLAPGKMTPAQAEAARHAVRHDVLIVQSSRAGSGRVLERSVLREDGIVVADNLNPQKARVLAMVALTRTRDHAEIQRMFREY